MNNKTHKLMRNEIARLHKACDNYQREIKELAAKQIDFDFRLYSKGDLIDFCYGKNSNVDPAIPLDCMKAVRNATGSINGHLWYVMDYTGKHNTGKLVNLKEKFFEVVSEKLSKQNL